MKHDDLWNDSLDDAIPPGLAAQSLATLQRASRRAKRRRSAAGAAALALACATAALVPWHGLRSARQPLLPPVIVARPESAPVQVRYLNDEEFVARLNEAGFGIVITHYGDANQVQLVPNTDPGEAIPY